MEEKVTSVNIPVNRYDEVSGDLGTQSGPNLFKKNLGIDRS